MGNNDTNLNLANVIFDLAKQAEESGKYDNAIKSYKEALNVFEQILGIDNERTKEVYTNIGMCYKALGNNEEALNYLTKALSNSNATSAVQKQEEESEEDDEELEDEDEDELEDEDVELLQKAYKLYDLGKEKFKNKKYKEAIDDFKEATIIFAKVFGDDCEYLAYIYEYIARCYQDKKDYNEAINYYAWSLEIFDKIYDDDNEHSVKCYEMLGYCYYFLGNYEQALYYSKESLERLHEDSPNRDNIIEFINDIEDNYDVEYVEAEDYDNDEEDYKERNNKSYIMQTTNNLGVVRYTESNNDKWEKINRGLETVNKFIDAGNMALDAANKFFELRKRYLESKKTWKG